MRETLQAKSVEEKRSQLRRIEAHIAAKEAENASVALHLTGELRGCKHAWRDPSTSCKALYSPCDCLLCNDITSPCNI